MTKFISVVAASLLSASAMAGGEGAAQNATAATFDSLDKNADQQISRTEAAANKMVADHFAALDTNGDGYVNKAEYAAAARPKS